MITERQEQILNTVIREYIEQAQPVSSQLLEEKHNFRICPATIRLEMQKLTDQGYLCQPHTSAGRMPTDKGYRFFVDELLDDGDGVGSLEKILETSWDIPDIAKFLASESSNLALAFLPEEKILWKEGWKNILKKPEFEEIGFAPRFVEMLDDFEKSIETLINDSSLNIHIYIGRENPFSKIKDFSIITAGVFSIVGPKRMNYDKNISLINSAIKWTKKKKKHQSRR